MSERDILIDLSRLIWRVWRSGLPTGIDRVCLAYVQHYRRRAKAVVQWRGRVWVFSSKDSDVLFDLVFRTPAEFRRAFPRFLARALLNRRGTSPERGQIYVNVGHTGLEERGLRGWIEKNELRAVFMVHDLIPLVHPEYCRSGEGAKHRRRIENVLACARGIIGNSQDTLQVLHEFARSRELSLPSTVSALIAGAPVPERLIPKRFSQPHFVTVGTIEARKNHLLLLHIWRRLIVRYGASAPLLVIVGRRGWEASQTFAMLDRASDLAGHVIELSQCDDDELAGLLGGARALLMPSLVEGFGLPVAEALQLGTPVIASELVVFREFAGDIPTYLDPLDGPAWESAIEAFAWESGDRERQKRDLRAYCAPNWREHFEVIDDWLQTLP